MFFENRKIINKSNVCNLFLRRTKKQTLLHTMSNNLTFKDSKGKKFSISLESTNDDDRKLKLVRQLVAERLEISNSNCLLFKAGFPPKPIDIDDSQLIPKYLYNDLILIEILESIDEKENKNELEENSTASTTDNNTEFPDSFGRIKRKTIVADNKCLFRSIAYCLMERKCDDELVATVKSKIVEFITNHPDIFTDAVLDQPRNQYLQWLQKDDSWGGAIELRALSLIFKCEICVFDLNGSHPMIFGQDQSFDKRIFLLFTGIHYDPLEFEENQKFTTVLKLDANMLLMNELMEDCNTFVGILQSLNANTDTSNFKLKCLTCNALFKGMKEAEQHGTQTSHSNFSQT